jgi:hypothetical protein
MTCSLFHGPSSPRTETVFNREHCVRNGGLARACFFVRESLANLNAPPTLLVITVSGSTIPAYHVVKNGAASITAFWILLTMVVN